MPTFNLDICPGYAGKGNYEITKESFIQHVENLTIYNYKGTTIQN